MKKIFSILIICVLTVPVMALDDVNNMEQNDANSLVQTGTIDSQPLETVPEQELNQTQEPEVVKEELPNLPTVAKTTFKQPTSKRKLAKRFIIGMLSVAGCSIFLFIVLSIYNRIREILLSGSSTLVENESSLETPNELSDAIKGFIDKTKW